jgi:hypothetical protein
MANKLKNIFSVGTDEIVQDFIINSWHVSQSVDALTAAEEYDISISGSLNITGSVRIDELITDGALTNFVVIDTSTGLLKKRTGGDAGSSGTSGSSGISGTSGTSGSSGTSGVSVQGPAGNDGSSGTSGSSGSSGTSGTTVTGLDTRVLYFNGDDNPAGDAGHTWNDGTNTLTIITEDSTGTSGASNLILSNSLLDPQGGNEVLGRISVRNNSDDHSSTSNVGSMTFGVDDEWSTPDAYPTNFKIHLFDEELGYEETKFTISNTGSFVLNNYETAIPDTNPKFYSTRDSSTSHPYKYYLGVDIGGQVVQISPYYSGSNYDIIAATRIDYNSNTVDNFASSTPYQFLVDTVGWGSAIPDADKILIDNATKASISGLKINIGAFTQEMNIVTPTSQSRVIIGNTAGNYATYNIKKSTIADGGASGDYLTLITEWVSNTGGATFTAGSNLGALRFRPISNTTTSTIYPISNYYTSIVFGNLSLDDDVDNTIFGFWLDETFRGTLVSGDELIVSAKFSSTTGFSTTGNRMDFITFNNDGSAATPPVLRRNFLTRINTPSSPAVFQVSDTINNWGPSQIFKFQYWERGANEYGLIELNSFNTRQQPSSLN